MIRLGTLVGRQILKASAESNLKKVTLELGGKSPTLILDDSNLDDAIKWAAFGIAYVCPHLSCHSFPDSNQYVIVKSFNHGQTCCAGSRVFVHESVYDKFIQKFTDTLKAVKVGDPFHPETYQGPQVHQVQYNVRSLFSVTW